MANDLFLIFLSILHDVAVPRGCNSPAASSRTSRARVPLVSTQMMFWLLNLQKEGFNFHPFLFVTWAD